MVFYLVMEELYPASLPSKPVEDEYPREKFRDPCQQQTVDIFSQRKHDLPLEWTMFQYQEAKLSKTLINTAPKKI
jgi:hypothetical protein